MGQNAARVQRPKDLGGMSPDDVKKIMAKGNRKSRRKGEKLKGGSGDDK